MEGSIQISPNKISSLIENVEKKVFLTLLFVLSYEMVINIVVIISVNLYDFSFCTHIFRDDNYKKAHHSRHV